MNNGRVYDKIVEKVLLKSKTPLTITEIVAEAKKVPSMIGRDSRKRKRTRTPHVRTIPRILKRIGAKSVGETGGKDSVKLYALEKKTCRESTEGSST